MGIGILPKGPLIYWIKHSFPNWETLGAPHRTRVYCLGNIRSTVLFQLGEGMTCLPNRKELGIMAAVGKSPKRSSLGKQVDDYIWPASFTEYAAAKVIWGVMPSALRLKISGSNTQGMTPHTQTHARVRAHTYTLTPHTHTHTHTHTHIKKPGICFQ